MTRLAIIALVGLLFLSPGCGQSDGPTPDQIASYAADYNQFTSSVKSSDHRFIEVPQYAEMSQYSEKLPSELEIKMDGDFVEYAKAKPVALKYYPLFVAMRSKHMTADKAKECFVNVTYRFGTTAAKCDLLGVRNR